MKILLRLIPLVILALFIFLARQSKYNDFHRAKIDGRIDTIYRYRNYVMLVVDKVEYRIIPVPQLGNNQLDIIARIGDTIRKKANCNNFILLHEGDEAYGYSVKKW